MTEVENILSKIKYLLSCGNDAQAERLIEQYGFDKQEQTKQLILSGVVFNEASNESNTITLELNKPVVSKLSDWTDESEVKLNFKKGDYLTYIGGSATKYLEIGKQYRTTWGSTNAAGRVAVIGKDKKRMVLPMRFFTI
tara:strand:- start:22 stop:438 length:417 start_codon:yes stop_codon:yes gene_type:complete